MTIDSPVTLVRPSFANSVALPVTTITAPFELDFEDTTPPVITLIGSNPLSWGVGVPFVDPGATALDNVDGNITADIVVGGDTVVTTVPDTFTITYNVSDAALNAAVQVSRTVNVVDDVAPVITRLGADPMTVGVGGVFTDPGVTALDNLDGNLTSSVIVGGDTVVTTVPDVFVLTYDVSDAALNAAATVTRTVNVVESPATASWRADENVSNDPVEAWTSESSQILTAAAPGDKPIIGSNFKPGYSIKFDGVDDVLETRDATVFPASPPLLGGCAIFAMRLTSIGSEQVLFSVPVSIQTNAFFTIGVTAAGKMKISYDQTTSGYNGYAIGSTTLAINTNYVIIAKVHHDDTYSWNIYINGSIEFLTYTKGANFDIQANKWFTDPSLAYRKFFVGATKVLDVLEKPFHGELGACKFWKPNLTEAEALAESALMYSEWVA